MNRLNLGNIKVFPGNQLIAYNENGSELSVHWGLDVLVGSSKKLWCNQTSFSFYRGWKPVVIKCEEGFYGGISNEVSLLVFAKDFKAIKYDHYDDYFKLHSESVKKGG